MLRKKLDSTPDLLAVHQFKPDTYPYLLASNTEGAVNTRYSILMAYPQSTKVQKVGEADILSHIPGPFISQSQNSDLPFTGGWFVFLSYEYVSLIEPSVAIECDENDLPLAFISRIPAAIIIDHALKCCTIVAEDGRGDLIRQIEKDIEITPDLVIEPLSEFFLDEENPDIYQECLTKIHQFIMDGDIFQANLSRLWKAEYSTAFKPVSLYHNLRKTNPSPFAALVKYQNQYILSSSPERLISIKNGIAETRPIAGTHPRGDDPEEDVELSTALLSHPKERAEHVMLIDLERNDLGRICQPGSIHVQDKMMLESYSFVHHIVSAISGSLKENLSVKDIIHAVFPGGTITGCPKVRCMQIINELEQAARVAYTGSIGYISNDGQMDLNILIRTMTTDSKTVKFRAGAGIVCDSNTEKELNETRHKAKGLISAL